MCGRTRVIWREVSGRGVRIEFAAVLDWEGREDEGKGEADVCGGCSRVVRGLCRASGCYAAFYVGFMQGRFLRCRVAFFAGKFIVILFGTKRDPRRK